LAAYRIKVTVRTKGKEFPPGSILPAGISESDLAFLKEKKFVELAEVPAVVYDEDDSEDNFEGFDEVNPGGIKSAEEIQRLRAKKDVAAYASSIGLDLGDWNGKSLKVLQEEVINYQEEQIGKEEGEGEDGQKEDQEIREGQGEE